jgi:hypothetical protein
MGVTLLSLQITREASIESSSGNQVTRVEHIAQNGLKVHLILSPDGDPEVASLGFVDLHIEAQPRSLADMTPDQTVDFLRMALKKML